MVAEHRKKEFAGLHELLISNYNNNVFSAASIAFYDPRISAAGPYFVSCGRTEDKRGDSITEASLFDLASLTKPLVTLLSIISLIENKKIYWDEPLDSLLHCNIPDSYARIDVHSLLCHSSGLPAHRSYWRDMKGLAMKDRKKWIKEKILTEQREYTPGTEHVYSDLGYILLGFIVEEKTGMGLDSHWYETIAEPLNIKSVLHFPGIRPDRRDKRYVATGRCGWSGAKLNGIVHDDNCRALGGVCGHAGLFGSASAVLALCQELLCLLKGEKSRIPIPGKELRRASSRVGFSEWTPGFSLPSNHGASCGSHFSSNSIGHLGFTGTSFWIDVHRETIVVFLSNRVIKGADQKGIKTLRPKVHNYIYERLEEKEGENDFPRK